MSEKKVGVLFASLFMIVLFIGVGSAVVTSCSVKSSCSGGETRVMGLSSYTNAHGESSGTYPYVLCCDGDGSTTCSGTNKILGLSSGTNAHAEAPDMSPVSYIGNDVCYNNLECVAADGVSYPNCVDSGPNQYPIKMLSISDMINAHLGNFSAYNLKICCKESSTPLIPDAYWAKTNGTYIPESERILIVTEVTRVLLFLKNSLPNTSVKFEIYEDDGVIDDNIRVGSDAITGTTDSNGNVNVSWIIEANDITKAGILAESDYEFFFKVSNGGLIATSGILNVSVYGDETSCNIRCRDYDKDSCEEDPCSVSDESAEETFGITCGGIFNGDDGCERQYACGSCSWNETLSECSPSWPTDTKTNPNCPFITGCSLDLVAGGTCIANEDVNDDCSDGFLTYSWTGGFEWAGSNTYNPKPVAECIANPNWWIEDPSGSGIWHYDPDGKFSACTTGATNTLECPSRIKLPFFSFLNLVIAVLVIILVYVIINSKKNNSIKRFFRKKSK